MEGAGVSAGIPVICIGNPIVGGAGKTPTALAVADACRKLRLSPGFLTRGYGGRETGPLVVSSAIHSARDVGDEALLLEQSAPTVVSVERPGGAKLLASLGVDIVVMDDGFQNPSLAKDLAILVVDGVRGTGNGHREAGQAALEVFTEWKSIYVDYSGKLQRAQIDNREEV